MNFKSINSFLGVIYMGKLCAVILMACCLAGCAQQPVMETVADEPVLSSAAAKQIVMELPGETVLPVMRTDTGELYICSDFEVSVETLMGGDLERTVQMLTGFGIEDVTVMETAANGRTRYDLAWSCMGEMGPEVGRAAVLSDGEYHYCLTVMTAEENAAEYREMFNGMFESFTLD